MSLLKKALFCASTAAFLATGLASASEADIRKAASEWLAPGHRIDEISKSPIAGLFEVRVGVNIFYSDDKGKYFIMGGSIADAKTKRNLTEERRNKLLAIKFSDLPLEQAIKTVRGNGKRVFATFEDPNCGYCKKLAKDVGNMTDYTMYTFLYPILGADSVEKSKNIWCAADRSKTWMGYMTQDIAPTTANCDTPLQKNLALGDRLGVHGTPQIFLINGERIPGFMSAEQLEHRLASAAGNAK